MVDYYGDNALHIACRKVSHPGQIEFLLKAGVDALHVNHVGETLLHQLAKREKGHLKTLESKFTMLLEQGLSFKVQDHRERTPFHVLCGIVPEEPYPLGEEHRKTLLGYFFDAENGAARDIPNNQGIRPVHLAATLSQGLVATLIESGVGTTVLTYEGRNLLHIAARSRQCNILGLVLYHYREIGRLDLLESEDSKGRTPLHDACRSGIPKSVALLLKAGACVHAKSNNGLTTLPVCAKIKEEETLWETEQKAKGKPAYGAGILVQEKSRPMNRPYHYSYRKIGTTAKVRDVVRLLLSHGADHKDYVKKHGTPLDAALNKGWEPMVAELLPLHEDERDIDAVKRTRMNCVMLRHKHVKDVLTLGAELLKAEEYEAIELLANFGMNCLSKKESPINERHISCRN